MFDIQILSRANPGKQNFHHLVRDEQIIMKRKLTLAFTLLAGLFLVGVAIFTTQIGLDHNTNLGADRILMLMVGSLIFLSALFFYFVISRLGRIYFLAGLLGLFVLTA